MINETEKLAAAVVCLESAVGLLKEEGMAKAGEYDGLLAYQVLTRIKNQALAFGLDLQDIGLAGFDPDTLLHKPRKAA